MGRISLLASVILNVCMGAMAQDLVNNTAEQSPDKSGYTIFNPTPSAFMRELNADRLDKTDCPFTVDAERFQIEVDFANLTYDRLNPESSNVRFTAFEISPMNLKVGLLNNLDFQLVFTPFRWEKTYDFDTRTVERKSGFDGITPRFKLNLVGNDGGFFALAVIPFVKFPLSDGHFDNGFIEGGLGVPFSFDVPSWDVGFQTTFHFNHNDFGGGNHVEMDNSASIGHAFICKFSLSAELFSSVNMEQGPDWVGTGDTWLTYQVDEQLRFDGGVYIGMTYSAEEWHPCLGMTWRF